MGRPKRFTAMQPDTEKSSTNSYESRPKRFKITPATENSTANSRDSRPKHFKVTPHSAGSISPTKNGACSRPSSNGSGRVVTMPPTQVPDYMYSSDSSDDDDDDDEEEEVTPTSIETTTKSCKKKSYWTVSLIDEMVQLQKEN